MTITKKIAELLDSLFDQIESGDALPYDWENEVDGKFLGKFYELGVQLQRPGYEQKLAALREVLQAKRARAAEWARQLERCRIAKEERRKAEYARRDAVEAYLLGLISTPGERHAEKTKEG